MIRSWRRALIQYDERFNDSASLGVRKSDHRAFPYCRVHQQSAFHFGGCDVVACGYDHVIGAALEPEIAVLVYPITVTGKVPTLDDVIRLPRIIQVPTSRRAADSKSPGVIVKVRLQIIIHYAGFITGQGSSG